MKALTFGKIGANLAKTLSLNWFGVVEFNASGVNDFLSFRNCKSPTPPEPSVSVIPINNF